MVDSLKVITDDSNSLSTLSNKVLIASPYCHNNGIFNQSVIYVAAHSERGGIGLIVNNLVNCVPMGSFLSLGRSENQSFMLPLHLGGPTDSEKVFVLHTNEYDKNTLFSLPGTLSISSNFEIINDISKGRGPNKSLFAMGCVSWHSNQLEEEILKHLWIVVEEDEEIIFAEDNDRKWSKALQKNGIPENMFAAAVGCA